MNMSREVTRRVVVTGVGQVSPLGITVQELWDGLRAGRSGVGDIPHLGQAAFKTRLGGVVRDFNARKLIADPKSLKLMTRPVRLGMAAMELAVKDAALALDGIDPFRIGCFVGSPGHAGDRDELLPAVEISALPDGGLDLHAFGGPGIESINPLWLLKSLANIGLYFCSLKLGAQGANGNICMSGAGGVMALGEAFQSIRSGRADLAIAGGYESLLEEERLESFEPSGLLYLGDGVAAAASRPFDRRRAGFVPSEGGAFLMLEERGFALARGAKIYGEVIGYGCANPGRAGRPNDTPEAFLGAMQAALTDARFDPWELDAVYAYGLATDRADRAEAEALKQLLTARSAYIPVTAVKSMTGNLLAGSGPLEVIAALGTLADGKLPAILNCEEPDPDLGLDYVRGSVRDGNYQRILVNAGSLGGTIASIIVQRAG